MSTDAQPDQETSRKPHHGHCYICGGLLPPERQDQGGMQCCSTACRHIEAIYQGRTNERHYHCVVCGAVSCSDPCAYTLVRLRTAARAHFGSTPSAKEKAKVNGRPTSHGKEPPRTMAPPTCVVCDAPTQGSKWCSDDCRNYDRKANPPCKSQHKQFSAAEVDDYRPTQAEWDAMWEGCARLGLIGLAYEVEHVILEASALRGVGDHQLAMELHTDGPDWAVALKNLGCSRRLKQAFDGPALLKNDEE